MLLDAKKCHPLPSLQSRMYFTRGWEGEMGRREGGGGAGKTGYSSILKLHLEPASKTGMALYTSR